MFTLRPVSIVRAVGVGLCTLGLLGCGRGDTNSSVEADPQSRYVLGVPAPTEIEALGEVEISKLASSISSRRKIAWELVGRVLRGTSLRDPRNPGGAELASVPRWLTWYSREDFDRFFRKIYGDKTKEERRARSSIVKEQVAEVARWNAHFVETLPSWTTERLGGFIDGAASPSRARGLAGLSRTLYSPEALTHLLENYGTVKSCFETEGPNCYSGEFPAGAVVVKAAWQRSDFGLQMPLFRTDAESLQKRLAPSGLSWDSPDAKVSPDLSKMYEMTTESGAHFQLTGLHIMSKTARDWLWITLWWSSDPESDFGADRPAELSDPSNPWRNYKMCVVSSFAEQGEVEAGFAARFPSLSAALAVTKLETAGESSWCSNPYLEFGEGNQRTNCIGCHQHGGIDLTPEEIIADESRFPSNGRTRLRETFTSDYLWSIHRMPEQLGGLVSERIKFHDINDQ